MSVNYDFYTNPKPSDSKKGTRYHARVVPKGTINSESLAEEIQNRCSLTKSDVAAALVALADITAEKLARGYSVQLDGIGSFHMTLKCPAVRSSKEIRSESIEFKSLAFRPSLKIRNKLKTVTLVKKKDNLHSKSYTNEEIDALLAKYFKKYETITRIQFQQLCKLTCSTAIRQLRRLREEKKIVNIASSKHPLYRSGMGEV